jgi:hypothetical protein
MLIFSLIFKKIGKPVFSKEAVFSQKVGKKAENNFFPNFSSLIAF